MLLKAAGIKVNLTITGVGWFSVGRVEVVADNGIVASIHDFRVVLKRAEGRSWPRLVL